MAGELIKSEAICLNIHPWSKTSHIVSWLTPYGKVSTVVKGAVRSKSFFLGQYDLNYTCEIVYYAGAKNEVHALRDAFALDRRDYLRDNYKALLLAEYFRYLASTLAPHGPDAAPWYNLLSRALGGKTLSDLLEFEISALRLAGVSPDFHGCPEPFGEFHIEEGSFKGESSRKMPISPRVASCLLNPSSEKNIEILLDAERVIGVYYNFHLEISSDRRRTLLQLIGGK